MKLPNLLDYFNIVEYCGPLSVMIMHHQFYMFCDIALNVYYCSSGDNRAGDENVHAHCY